MPQVRQAPDAKTVLSGLVGRPIRTLTGKPNHVLRLEGVRVIVGTNRNPAGQPVEVATVQSAIDELYAAGELAISKDTVGYRSAFIGAVIRQLPGVHVSTNPRRAFLTTANE